MVSLFKRKEHPKVSAVIPSEAWESPASLYRFALRLQEIATGLRPRNDSGGGKLVILVRVGNIPSWSVGDHKGISFGHATLYNRLNGAAVPLRFSYSSVNS